jgi:hypothetical protein
MPWPAIAAAVESALAPGRFFVAEGRQLRIEHQSQEACRWEIFRGHLLDARQTRLEKTFTTWNVILDPPGRPIISVRYQSEEEKIYVVRYIEVYAWEAYEQRGIIESREVKKWAGELVGTMDLTQPDLLKRSALEHLTDYLHMAVVGADRLPITSLESPLPWFSLGQLAYFPAPAHPTDLRPVRKPLHWLAKLAESSSDRQTPGAPMPRTLELVLRASSPPDIAEVAARFASLATRPGPEWEPVSLLRTLFNYVALSPYTSFAPNWSRFLLEVARQNKQWRERALDVFSYMLRHLVRHLTSYNLTSFHNSGANYPDALTLNEFLKAYVQLLGESPGSFLPSGARHSSELERHKGLRRRALRQAWMMRKLLEGLPVPRFPTSPGENLRVMPEPFERLPNDEILNPSKRPKFLFEGEAAESLLSSVAWEVFRSSLAELSEPAELKELGLGVFLDRPLGIFKQPGEVDRTPLLSYEAVSRSIAQSRLAALNHGGVLSPDLYHRAESQLQSLAIMGIPATELPDRERPGVPSLEEAGRSAADFTFLRITTSSWNALQNWAQLRHCFQTASSPRSASPRVFPSPHLVIRSPRQRLRRTPPPLMTAFDEQMAPLWDLFLDRPDGGDVRYRESRGVEMPEGALRIAELA